MGGRARSLGARSRARSLSLSDKETQMAVEWEGESGGVDERRRVWKRTCRVHNNVRLILGGLLGF